MSKFEIDQKNIFMKKKIFLDEFLGKSKSPVN
jgi:hypothetical protein